jgi:hypothetical protein
MSQSLGTPPSSLGLEVVLGEFISHFSTSSSERNVEDLITAAVRSLVDEAVPPTTGATGSILERVKAKDVVRAKLIQGLDVVVEQTGRAVADSVRRVFDNADAMPLRLQRFEVLRDVICEAVLEHTKTSAPDFVAFARERIDETFLRMIGRDVNQIDRRLTSDMIAEIAVGYLVAPVLGETVSISNKLMSFLRKKDEPMAATAATAATSRGRGRTRPVAKRKRGSSAESDDEASDGAMAEGGGSAGGAAALQDGGDQFTIDEKSLLTETCAQQRADLAEQKHKLFTALFEIEGL